MIHKFHPEALEEADIGTQYYDAIKSSLGDDFHAQLEKAIEQAVSFPFAAPILEEDIRRVRIKHFQYGVVYSVEKTYVFVIAVMHLKREPGYWKHRLPKR